VLVTGGAGYVGSHACEALARAGFLPVAYDNLTRGSRSLVRYGPFEHGDVRDIRRLEAVLRRYRPVAAMHFAALAYVGESVARPDAYHDHNVVGSLRLLEAMARCGVARMVFSSTCATYGVAPEQPIRESAPQRPINPYGVSKLMVEKILRDRDAAQGLRSVSLRYFNACGAHPAAEIGEMHDPEPHLVPRAIMAALGEIDALDVFGTDHPTPDGTAVRDYIHVCDLAEAHLAALSYLLDGGATTALNLGTGRGHSVFEIVKAVRRVGGREVPLRIGSRRVGDPPVLVAECSAARRVLGFAAQWTDIEETIATAWRWHARSLLGGARGVAGADRRPAGRRQVESSPSP
jgi:UDP-arabinose 4-epimerase